MLRPLHTLSQEGAVTLPVVPFTGPTGTYDPLNNRGIMLAKSLAGYVDTSHGKRLVFAICVNNVPFENADDMMAVGNDLGSIA